MQRPDRPQKSVRCRSGSRTPSAHRSAGRSRSRSRLRSIVRSRSQSKERARLKPLETEHVPELVQPVKVCLAGLYEKISNAEFLKGDRRLSSFPSTARQIVSLALDSEEKGGFGLICAPRRSYIRLQKQGVKFPVTDKSDRFPDGYMTQQLDDSRISSHAHQTQVCAFAEKTDDDKWPPGHEAAGLPKDGYHLYGTSGFCRLGAARIVGLPSPTCEWEGVGMRHTTALQLCCALRGSPAVVAVRSECGHVHVLLPSKAAVEVFRVAER